MVTELSEHGVAITPVDIHPSRLDEMPTYEILFPFNGTNHGKPYTKIPNRDLRRYAKKNTKWGHVAKRELKRRGTNYVDDPVEPSFHALDRLSELALDLYLKETNQQIGLKTWAVQKAAAALAGGRQDAKGRYILGQLKFIFDFRPQTPVLVTVLDNRGDWGKGTITVTFPNEG